ncbi:DUF815 domain-containing protein [Pseudomonas hunanensis]|uniref:DUF815 domain-containing protein n=1 Tax=Pseudomonas hunanensis TaxID=1247546 RepID=UPI0015BC5937|nr:DUF815 domain-containing protein [Pseudomonas hunanensis]
MPPAAYLPSTGESHGENGAQYPNALYHWLAEYSVTAEAFEQATLHTTRWATQRGSRSGRIAAQFARDYTSQWASQQ